MKKLKRQNRNKGERKISKNEEVQRWKDVNCHQLLKFKISERETQDGDIHSRCSHGNKFLECDEVTGAEVKDISKLLDHPNMTTGAEVDRNTVSKIASQVLWPLSLISTIKDKNSKISIHMKRCTLNTYELMMD